MEPGVPTVPTVVPVNTVRRVVSQLYANRQISAEERSVALHFLNFDTEGMEVGLHLLSDKLQESVRQELQPK